MDKVLGKSNTNRVKVTLERPFHVSDRAPRPSNSLSTTTAGHKNTDHFIASCIFQFGGIHGHSPSSLVTRTRTKRLAGPGGQTTSLLAWLGSCSRAAGVDLISNLDQVSTQVILLLIRQIHSYPRPTITLMPSRLLVTTSNATYSSRALSDITLLLLSSTR